VLLRFLVVKLDNKSGPKRLHIENKGWTQAVWEKKVLGPESSHLVQTAGKCGPNLIYLLKLYVTLFFS